MWFLGSLETPLEGLNIFRLQNMGEESPYSEVYHFHNHIDLSHV